MNKDRSEEEQEDTKKGVKRELLSSDDNEGPVSLKILHISVSLSNPTQIAVQKKYLKVVRLYGFPKVARANKEVENMLMAATHLAFRKRYKPRIFTSKCWAYGTSTKNQRINDGGEPWSTNRPFNTLNTTTNYKEKICSTARNTTKSPFNISI
jgi:hypothetical protein